MNSTIFISRSGIAQTLQVLQRSGQRCHEGIAFWLGRRAGEFINVVEVYEPAHEAEADYFRIPPSSMQALQLELKTKRLMIAAQVHSHPKEAFHSLADDTWAVIRHVGAVSIVLPNFAAKTNADSLFRDAAVFQLNGANRWMQVLEHKKVDVCQISQ
jgi:proteasome lid subunit RPN8/RPN11